MKALRKNLQLSLALLLSLYAPLSLATLTDDLQLVGEARLRVLFWSIYDSSLYTTSGKYFGVEPKLTLRINYLRKIKSGQLLDRTSEEWEKNSIIEQDIEDGKRLKVRRTPTFFVNGKRLKRLGYEILRTVIENELKI